MTGNRPETPVCRSVPLLHCVMEINFQERPLFRRFRNSRVSVASADRPKASQNCAPRNAPGVVPRRRSSGNSTGRVVRTARQIAAIANGGAVDAPPPFDDLRQSLEFPQVRLFDRLHELDGRFSIVAACGVLLSWRSSTVGAATRPSRTGSCPSPESHQADRPGYFPQVGKHEPIRAMTARSRCDPEEVSILG